MLRDRNILLRSTAVTPEIKGSTRAPVLRRGGRTDRGLAPGVDRSARNASLHLLASFQLRMLGLLRQVDLLGSASSRKRSFYDESLLSFSGGESSKSLRVSLRLLSASLIGEQYKPFSGPAWEKRRTLEARALFTSGHEHYSVGDGCVTFGVVVRAPVPNGRMSDPFPCGSWPYHSVPDGQRGIRLNSSLYVSGPTGRAGALRSFFLCGTMPGREGNASRRRTTTTQPHLGFSLHEMSPVHWTDG
ncbi:hypothetical protein FEM48_ZijujMtG0003600 (mitochondrion) [Ziziphus jujuba var. spinosa]|uniref:Uncharacterized protein n=1 Tax=Ziziphus jujuba var. spinosa TaxID=714518 RepID=A0A978UA81_ZIZJJ|nr:hypothetical protein FEM48_ZijujMtG0003600 [Ziziphus jujuba var. spinosa]